MIHQLGVHDMMTGIFGQNGFILSDIFDYGFNGFYNLVDIIKPVQSQFYR